MVYVMPRVKNKGRPNKHDHLPFLRDFSLNLKGWLHHHISNEQGQISLTYLYLYLHRIFWCWSWRLKIANNLPDSAGGLGALRHHRLPYHINDSGLRAPLSSSLDYDYLLNYFLETNLFFNLGQMAIWPTVIAPFPLSPCDALLQQMLKHIRPADERGQPVNRSWDETVSQALLQPPLQQLSPPIPCQTTMNG